MKQSKINVRYVTAVAIASFAGLVSACGSSGSSSVNSGIGVAGVGVTSTCAPLSQIMSFNGNAAYIDSANLYAGSQYGSTLGIGSGGATSGNEFINTVMPPVDNYQQRVTSDLAYLGLNVTSTGYVPTSGTTYNGGYTSGQYGTSSATQPAIQGSFAFSSADWSYLLSMFQNYGTSNNGYYGSTTIGVNQTTLSNVQACNLSINSGVYSWNNGQGQGTLYGGYITMTVNGQTLKFQI